MTACPHLLRRYGPTWAAFDGKLPPKRGWPRHPLAPREFSVDVLQQEKQKYSSDVAKLQGKAATPASSRPLRAAQGKLVSVTTELERLAHRSARVQVSSA